MNRVLSQNQPVQQFADIADNQGENNTPGERIAAALLLFYTASALIISGWSAVDILSGNIENGGPIGMFVRILQTSGIV